VILACPREAHSPLQRRWKNARCADSVSVPTKWQADYHQVGPWVSALDGQVALDRERNLTKALATGT